MGIVKATLQTELINRCIDHMYQCAIKLNPEEEQKFVALAQIVLREFDALSPADKHKVLSCHRTVKMPSGEYYRLSDTLERRREYEEQSESLEGSARDEITDESIEPASD